MYKRLLILFVCSWVSISLSAQISRINNQAGLNSALASAQAGDTIVVNRSHSPYTDLEIIFNGNGTVTNPIVIMAEKTGEVILTGNSVVRIGGGYVFIEGFSFGGDSPPDGLLGKSVIEFRSSTSSSDWCNNCRIKNISFDAHNQSSNNEEEKLKWVSVYGQDNEVVNSTFTNKQGIGNCITVERPDIVENRTLIHHNYFANRVPVMNGSTVLNDQDAIRIGYSGTSLSDANCQVYDNFFYNWDGEPEIISNKSGRNRYFNNTFLKCVGTITLRHGTNCEVFGNYFFGENISKSGGVRVIDSDHKIYNNYFQDLNTGGSKVVGAINLFKGDADFVIDGVLSSYAICEDNLVANNTIVNCDKGIWIGPDDSGREYEPRNLEIVNNIMINSSEAALIGTAPSGANIIKGNIKKGGTWWSGFSNADNLETSYDLTINDGSFERIKDLSEAIGYAVDLSNFTISKDILDGDRDNEPDSGAEEYNSTGMKIPYILDDVGVTVGVIESQTTDINNPYSDRESSFKIYPNPGRDLIFLEDLESGIKQVNIYDTSGRLLESNRKDSGQSMELDNSDLLPGVYILKLQGENEMNLSRVFIKK